jgi:CubicO group peptidase (beta-lactamase class C family)
MINRLFRRLLYGAAFTAIIASCSHDLYPESSATAPDPAEAFYTAFADSLEKGLDKSQYGYSIAMYSGSTLVLNRSAGERSKAMDAGGIQPFTNDTRMHIASLSKTLTAMGTLELLHAKGISVQDSVYKYLPAQWHMSADFKSITFHQLLTHTSGIRYSDGTCTNGDVNTYASLRTIAERDVHFLKTYCYQNANFGLLRIALPIINGLSITGNDATDDANTATAYEGLMQELVFRKRGLTDILCAWQPGYALLYTYPYTERPGFNAGNLLKRAGGLGWYLSANELGRVISQLSDPSDESILPNQWKDSLLLKGYGCFSTPTNKGIAYWHDGIWHWSKDNQSPQGMRSLWMKLPYRDVTVVVMVNALRDQGTAPAFPVANTGIVSYVIHAFNEVIKKRV